MKMVEIWYPQFNSSRQIKGFLRFTFGAMLHYSHAQKNSLRTIRRETNPNIHRSKNLSKYATESIRREKEFDDRKFFHRYIRRVRYRNDSPLVFPTSITGVYSFSWREVEQFLSLFLVYLILDLFIC